MPVRDTSLSIFQSQVLPTLSARQKRVYEILTQYPEGLTNAEIGYKLGWEINRVTGRSKELRDKKLVEDSQTRKCRVNPESTAHVQRLIQLNFRLF
jgi:hypothetical protein